MADKDASGRFDKQNERGGETSTEGAECSKKAVREGRFCLAKRGRENAVARNFIHVHTLYVHLWRKDGKSRIAYIKRCVLKRREIRWKT